ncbi:hypothetical protein [Lysobacter gummosus]
MRKPARPERSNAVRPRCVAACFSGPAARTSSLTPSRISRTHRDAAHG